MKEKTYFRSAPFFLLKGLDADEPLRFGLFSHHTLLKPSLEKKQGRTECLNDVVSLSETHLLNKKIAEAIVDVTSLLIGLTAIFRKKLIPINEEETLLSHVLSNYPKREFDLKKILEALPSLGEEEIPPSLVVSFAIGALSQKGLDQGEFFIELKNVAPFRDLSCFSSLDETKREMIKEFIKNMGLSTLDPSLFFKSPFFKGRYVPRLRYNKVIVSPARWFFDPSVIDREHIEASIEEVLETHQIDDVCFVENGENLKLICWREEIPFLAHVFKEFGVLKIVERLFTEKTLLIKGHGTSYSSEFMLPLLKEEAALQREEITRLHA